ncbi:hypothetical protein EB001_09095 [bacterium]|nr:hypothetical protein [bacterium]
MSTANTSLRVTELDFLSIRNNLKSFMQSQSQFQDFDFEGSGLAVLLDVLSYNTHYMGYYLNMVGNEMFLDTAQLRASVLSHAKNLNYVPRSQKGALVKANILVTPTITEDQVTNVITLDKFTKFLGQDIDGINYQFIAINSNTAVKDSGSFSFSNTYLRQGEITTIQYLMDPTNTSRRFTIPSANVDTDTITITVQESSSNTTTIEYNLAEDITELKSNTAAYFLEESDDLTYTFYFGDDVIGKKPKDGNIIICNYLDTVGSIANNISKFYLSDTIAGLYKNNVSITAANSSYGGTDKETINQVKHRAPYFYTTQNRAVTIKDYETILIKDYNNIDAVSVWGGEDNIPVVYGKVFMSFKTKGNYKLTNYEKDQIKTDIVKRRNVLTVTPEIVDPDYTYILVKGQVNYNSTLTSLSANEILTYVKASISDYVDAELNKFTASFRKSKLQAYIENSEKSITGSDLTIYVQKRVPLILRNSTYDINFNLPLQKSDYNNRLYTTPEIQTFDVNGISRNIFFEETPRSATGIDEITVLNGGSGYFSSPTITITGDGTDAIAEAVVNAGIITKISVTNRGINYTYANITITPNGSGSGATAIARLEAGTIDYETGALYLNSFVSSTGTPVNRYYDTDVFTVNIPSEKDIILPLRNRILTIDENDPLAIQITMYAEQ